MTKINPKAIELLMKLSETSDEELEAIRALSSEELDAELAEAGIDFPQFYQRIQQQIDQYPEPQTYPPDYREEEAGGRRWLRLTQEAIRRLGEWLSPEPSPALGYRQGAGRYEQGTHAETLDADFAWVPVSLMTEEERTYLELKARSEVAPEAAPALEVTLEGQPVAVLQQGYEPTEGIVSVVLNAPVPEQAVCWVSALDAAENRLRVRFTTSET